MKKETTAMVLAATIICLAAAQQVAASGVNGSIHISSKVQAGQVQAAKNSLVRLGSVKLKGSNLGSTLNVNNRVVIGGPTDLQRGAHVRIASLDLDNARIGGTTNLQMNVNVHKGVYAGRNSDIGLGGVEIAADENYKPLVDESWTNQGGGDNIYHPLPVLPIDDVNWSIISNINKTIQYAELSKCSYKDKVCNASSGWKPLTEDDLRKLGLDPSLFVDNKSGFHAKLFYNKQTDEYVLGFEGTDEGSDWSKGNSQAIPGYVPPQYRLAANLSITLNNNEKVGRGTLSFTGHSLGGGLASMASMVTGRKAVTFNAAGLLKNTVTIFSKNYISSDRQLYSNSMVNWQNRNELIKAYYVSGDVLNHGQKIPGIANAIGEHISLPNPKGIKDHPIDTVLEALEIERNQNELNNKRTFFAYY